MQKIILACLVVLAFTSDLKIYWQENSTAKCLDGTPAAFFIHEGIQKNKFVIYFEGGDLCVGSTY